MSRYCLDTSAYSQFRRGDSNVVDLLDSAEFVGVPSVVAGELCAGFRLGSRRAKNVAELDAFLAHAAVRLLEVDLDVARLYGEIVADLRRAGTPIPTSDIWVAATAVQAGVPVLTYDSDFGLIRRAGSIILERSGEKN